MATSADLANRLLAAAVNDELMAKSVLPVPGVTDAGVGMLAQQAVEKAIKAALAAKETEFPFVHDLEKLREFAKESGIELPTALNGIEALTPFAADERYGAETPIGLDRDQALKWATEAIAWAQGIVSQPKPNDSSTPESRDEREPSALG
jgi:HEPN domain-containing protein